MELKRARELAKTWRYQNDAWTGGSNPTLSESAIGMIILDDRIIELEAQRDVPRKTLRMLVDILENIHIEELRAELAKYGKDLPRFKDIIGLYADKAEASDKEE